MPDELSAELLLDACDHARTFARNTYAPLRDLAHAEALQTGIAVARIARGERAVGYKIGFTNRSIWPLYGVFHPIWGPVWNSTLHSAEAGNEDAGAPIAVDLSRFAQPRLEPEIVIGLRKTPREPTAEAVCEAADWFAHGFEIVQCPYPEWRFTAAEAVAAQSLHGALLLGPRRPIRTLGDRPEQVIERLAAIEVELCRNGVAVARGRGSAALDGPLHAIAHLAHELALRGHSIEPGSLVTTGTLTDAQPLFVGERWTSHIDGVELSGLDIRTVSESRTSPPVLR
ncbi:MAG: fumarylacetoacetate hydrolase family protein [Burkholderiaceae bacterium]|jgi:2-oxo-3-hexenedioate decarboxylase|nr:fumarylacetoacetate hydrolase family protein [Burkholderiaceae bacterium]